MKAEPKYIQVESEGAVTFSVCSLVRDQSRYEALLESFYAFGFTAENSEFLAADNREVNRFDGYSWHKRLHGECQGKYVIYCHEDIVLIDADFGDLVLALQNLEATDPNWLLAGVAGCAFEKDSVRPDRLLLRITDKFGADRRRGNPPGLAETLDECFIVMKRGTPVFPSHNLSGFHFYGPDICLMAELAGGNSWVIDFHLRHDGEGSRGNSFRQSRRAFQGKYAKIFPGRSVYCTTGRVQIPNGGEHA